MKQSKTYQLVTGFKWCNSWNVPYRHKDTQQFLWYNGEKVRIFYPNMTQVHILLNKVPYAVKCNKLDVNPYSYRQSLNFCFQNLQTFKFSSNIPLSLGHSYDWVWTVINLAYYFDKKKLSFFSFPKTIFSKFSTCIIWWILISLISYSEWGSLPCWGLSFAICALETNKKIKQLTVCDYRCKSAWL